MITADISKAIWNMKYRRGEETEEEFYQRIVTGIFGNLTEREDYTYTQLFGLDYQNQVLEMFRQHLALPAGRGLYSLGTDMKNQTFSNCFVLPIEKDSLSAIMDAVKQSAIVMKSGGGIGYSFSILRPKHSTIASTGSRSTGVLSFAKIFDVTCGTIEAGGNRRGAQIGVLGIWHPEVIDFIECKRAGDNLPPDLKPYKNFNLSVFVSDEFMTAVREDAAWDLIFPDTTVPEYDEIWTGNISDWKARGLPVVVYQTLPARELWDIIVKSNYDFAEPGILFEDTINRKNTLWFDEYILATNPCGEEPLIGHASCNLGSINLSQFIDNPFTEPSFDISRFSDTIRLMVACLDRILDINHYPLPEQKDIVKRKRLIGLGITGLGDALAMMKIKYGSEDCLWFINMISKTLYHTSYEFGVDLADWLDPFDDWMNFTSEQKLSFVYGEFLENLTDETKDRMFKYGVRNSRYLTIAPTGTTSMLMNNVSGGLEPIFMLEYERKVKQPDGTTNTETVETYSWALYKKMFGNDVSPPDFFVTTDVLEVDDHLNVQAGFQKYICASISKTINVPVDYPFEKYGDIFIKAHEKELKGCTTYRPNEIVGSVLSKKSDTVCSKETRPKGILPNCAPKRPQSLECDIFRTSIKGEAWIVLVGLLEDKPYEIFCGKEEEAGIAVRPKTGIIRKMGNGEYELEVKYRNSTKVFHDLASLLMNDEQKSVTRLISLSMRHGVLPRYIVEQLKKTQGAITAFSTAISRVLSKYVGVYTLSAGENTCPQCGEDSLIFSEGCVKCINCSYSRCGG